MLVFRTFCHLPSAICHLPSAICHLPFIDPRGTANRLGLWAGIVRSRVMSAHNPGSISRWIGDLKAGDAAAAQPLWERYFARLVQLARKRLRAAHRPAVGED